MLRAAVVALFVWPLATLAGQERDSAGVKIVENTRAARAGAQAWRLSPTPFVDIGGGAKAGPSDLALVMKTFRFMDGRIAVASQATNSVRYYDSTGRYLTVFGRRGSGPGEFEQLMDLHHLRGDTLIALSPRRLTVLGPRGNPLGELPMEVSVRMPWPEAFAPDGFSIGTDINRISADRSKRTGAWVDTVTLLLIPRDRSRTKNIGRLPAQPQFAVDGAASPYIFGPSMSFAAGKEGFYAGYQGSYDIRVLGEAGQLVRLIRRPPSKRTVPRSAIDAVKARMGTVTMADGSGPITLSPAQREQLIAGTRFMEHYPEFTSLSVDASSNLWVQLYNDGARVACGTVRCTDTFHNAGRFDVFDPAGRWITTVVTPADFTPTDFGTNYVGGVWRDAKDVEHVRYYRLIKP